MDKKEKIANLIIELEKLKEKYQHILTEYSATKEEVFIEWKYQI